MSSPLLAIDNLGFAWPRQAELLEIPTFRLERGESLFLKGPSGSGKTTLLGLIGGVQKAGRGSIRLLDRDLGSLSAGARDRFRVDHTGRSEEHTSELQSLMRTSYAVFCLKKKTS